MEENQVLKSHHLLHKKQKYINIQDESKNIILSASFKYIFIFQRAIITKLLNGPYKAIYSGQLSRDPTLRN